MHGCSGQTVGWQHTHKVRFVKKVELEPHSSEVEPNRDAGARVLKENGDFMLYVITVAMQKIQQISDIGTCDGPDGHNQKKLFAYMAQISRSETGSHNQCQIWEICRVP